MTTLYKLTDEEGQTLNNTQWGEGVSHSGTGEGNLCGRGYIHAYEHPLIAAFMNPVHAGFVQPLLWEAEGQIALREGPLKCGCVTLTTLRELPLPVLTTEQRVRIARECAIWCKPAESGAARWLKATAEAAWWAAAAWRTIEEEAAAGAARRATEAARWAAAEAARWAAAARRAVAARQAAMAAEAALRATAGIKELPLLAIIQQVLSEDSP